MQVNILFRHKLTSRVNRTLVIALTKSTDQLSFKLKECLFVQTEDVQGPLIVASLLELALSWGSWQSGPFAHWLVYLVNSASPHLTIFQEQNLREKFTNSFNETDCDFGNMSGECLNKYTGSHCLNIINYADCGSTARTTADAYVSNAVMDQKGVEDLVDNLHLTST